MKIMKLNAWCFPLIVSTIMGQSATAGYSPYHQLVFGVTCNQGEWDGLGQDLDLAFEYSPLRGITNATNGEFGFEYNVESMTYNSLGESIVILSRKKTTKNEGQVTALMFSTEDLFKGKLFAARFFKGQRSDFGIKNLKPTNCKAHAGNPQPIPALE